jgi:sulfide dehydrogenase cytochrome subunit
MRTLRTVVLTGLLVAVAPLSQALGALDELVERCDACHGKDGQSTHDQVPGISGMSASYLSDTLTSFRDGERTAIRYQPEQGPAIAMTEVVKDLSDADIQALSSYYAAKPFTPHPQQVDAVLARTGRELFQSHCEKCHSDGGTNPEDDCSLIGGQWKPYLNRQLKLIRAGKREVPKKMLKIVNKLDDGEVAAIVEFLAAGGK